MDAKHTLSFCLLRRLNDRFSFLLHTEKDTDYARSEQPFSRILYRVDHRAIFDLPGSKNHLRTTTCVLRLQPGTQRCSEGAVLLAAVFQNSSALIRTGRGAVPTCLVALTDLPRAGRITRTIRPLTPDVHCSGRDKTSQSFAFNKTTTKPATPYCFTQKRYTLLFFVHYTYNVDPAFTD